MFDFYSLWPIEVHVTHIQYIDSFAPIRIVLYDPGITHIGQVLIWLAIFHILA